MVIFHGYVSTFTCPGIGTFSHCPADFLGEKVEDVEAPEPRRQKEESVESVAGGPDFLGT